MPTSYRIPTTKKTLARSVANSTFSQPQPAALRVETARLKVSEPLYIFLVFAILTQLLVAALPASFVWAGYLPPIEFNQSQNSSLLPAIPNAALAPSPALAESQSQNNPAAAKTAYGQLPIRFEVNQGQVANATVKYLARGRGYNIFFTGEKAVLDLRQNTAAAKDFTTTVSDQETCPEQGDKGKGKAEKCQLTGSTRKLTKQSQADTHKSGLALGLTLTGARPSQSWKLETSDTDKLATTSNYFKGSNSATWKTGLANYSKLAYRQVYKDIDLIYYGTTGGQLEYDFVVAPGGNPGEIGVKLEGVTSLELAADNSGDLIVRAGAATSPLRQLRPQVYQIAPNGTRQNVGGSYTLRSQTEFGFNVGKYDTTRP